MDSPTGRPTVSDAQLDHVLTHLANTTVFSSRELRGAVRWVELIRSVYDLPPLRPMVHARALRTAAFLAGATGEGLDRTYEGVLDGLGVLYSREGGALARDADS